MVGVPPSRELVSRRDVDPGPLQVIVDYRLATFKAISPGDLMDDVTCAAFAPLPLSDYPPRRPQQNSGDAVVPFRLPCS